MRVHESADGVKFYPGIWAFTGISYLLGFYATRMSIALRITLMGSAASLVATTWLSSRKPRTLTTFAAELIWSSAAMLGGGRLAGLLDKMSARVTAANEAGTRAHADEQWTAGWASKHLEAEAIYKKVRETLSRARPETHDQIGEVAYALQELAQLAEDLVAAAAPPPFHNEE